MIFLQSGLNYIIWNGHNSLDFGVVISSSNAHIMPESDTESVEIPGRNGSLILTSNRYKNIDITYSCKIMPVGNYASYDEQLTAIGEWLDTNKNDSYMELLDSYDNGIYRLAKIVGNVEPKRENIYSFDLTFNCMPQKFYIFGNNWIDIPQTGIDLVNPSKYTASPMIVIFGNSSKNKLTDKLIIDDITYSFEDWTGSASANGNNYLNDVIIDFDLMDIYLSDGTPCNRYFKIENSNNVKSIPEVLKGLGTGIHTLSWIKGNAQGVKIQPRWWKI